MYIRYLFERLASLFNEVGRLSIISGIPNFLVCGSSDKEVSETEFGFLEKKLCWLILYELVIMCLQLPFMKLCFSNRWPFKVILCTSA